MELKDVKGTLYVAMYKAGKDGIVTKMFPHTGNLQSAIARFREHCIIQNFRFIHVWPAIVDLDFQDNAKKNNFDYQENDEFRKALPVEKVKELAK